MERRDAPSAAPHAPAEFRAQAEAVHAAQAERRAQFRAGVSWSGLSPDAPKVETVEEIADRLCGEANRRAIFRASPRGRLLSAIEALQADGIPGAGDLYGRYSRSIGPLAGPQPDPAAVDACEAILRRLDHPAARDGLNALAELRAAVTPARAA